MTPESTVQHSVSEHAEHESAVQVHPSKEKDLHHDEHLEQIDTGGNLVYDLSEDEPEIHLRTYIACAAMILVNFVQVLALQGPPSALSYIGEDLHGTAAQTWVPNALSLVQAVLTPIISSASDIFQARKPLMIGCYTISFIGCAIAPGAQNIYRLIGAQIMIGFGFSAVALVYTVPSEILPRKWRPMAQASINVAACTGACVGPLVIGAFTKADPENGWRNFFWVEMGLWGLVTIGIFVGYRPPPRHTRLDHLSFWRKLGHIDLIGSALLAAGLTLFLTGLNLGGNNYPWADRRVLATLIVGIVVFFGFGLYEWKGTKVGILHHDMFVGNPAGLTFTLCVVLIFLENFIAFAYIIFYPTMTTILFEHDPFLLAARCQPFWLASGLSTLVWGYWSTRFRTIKEPMFVGFAIFTAGVVGLATIQPDDSLNALVFAALAGIGFGAPLVLVVAGVHLSTPHPLIATATGVTCAARAVAGTVATAIYAAALTTRFANIPGDVSKAALGAGLPASSLATFIHNLMTGDISALSMSKGATPEVIKVALTTQSQSYADALRVIYIIAAPFGVLACVVCLFLGDLRQVMTFRVDAPVEELHAKSEHHHNDSKAV